MTVKKKVMLVGNDMELVESMASIMQLSYGVDTLVSYDAGEVLPVYQRERPDVVVFHQYDDQFNQQICDIRRQEDGQKQPLIIVRATGFLELMRKIPEVDKYISSLDLFALEKAIAERGVQS